MKKARSYQLDLYGFASNIEIYPTSSIDGELQRLYELTQRSVEAYAPDRAVLTGRQVTIAPVKSCLRRNADARTGWLEMQMSLPPITICRDADALEGDWMTIGGDFLNAYNKARNVQQQRRLHDEADLA